MDVPDPVVRTASGLVRGRRNATGIAVFKGIPFAEPPTGDLRFAAPRPARSRRGTPDATAAAPAPGPGPDDWLTVKVFAPDPGAAGLPVMVWIYGGAYRSGTSSLPGYDGTRFAQQNVVLVTFNHRVGVEGYAQLPGAPANRGLLDQVAALRWVRENIAAFGGDPARVTAFGEWAGAGGAARNVDLITGHTRDEYRLFMHVYGLRGRVSAELASEALAVLGPSTPAGAQAAYRAAYPEADPETLFELVHTDWLFRMPTLHLAQAHSASGGRTFLYEFRYPASLHDLGACHAIDVPLVFGAYQGIGQLLFGAEPPAAAVALGDLMREQWVAFATDGDPGWPLYSPGSRMTRIFDDPPDVAGYPQKASLHLWDQHRFGVLDLETQTAR